MTTLQKVEIASRFRRSVRIDVDINDPSALEHFYCPRSFADALKAMAQHLSALSRPLCLCEARRVVFPFL